MKEIIADKNLIAYCGLYCGACKSYLKEKCPGCREKGKYKKCKMRPCCIENNYLSCADCKEFEDAMKCDKFTNKLWNIMEFIFRTKRSVCLDLIIEKGYDDYALYMAKKKSMVIKKKHL